MGQKGDKDSNLGRESAEKLLDDLAVIPGITSKKMFGGYGIFHMEKMFAMVDSKGRAYFKAGPQNQKKFEESGGVKHSKMPYYTIPEDVRSRRDVLVDWANSAITESK